MFAKTKENFKTKSKSIGIQNTIKQKQLVNLDKLRFLLIKYITLNTCLMKIVKRNIFENFPKL